MKRVFATVVLSAILSISAAATAAPTDDQAVREGPTPLKPAEVRVGDLIDDVAFTDIDGEAGKLSDYRKHKALVVLVRSVDCPLSRKFGPTIADLEKHYAGKDVAFLFLNVQEFDSVESIRAEIKRFGFTSRYVHDPKAAIGKALWAKSTTEAFVLDAARTLRYRGPVDDQFGLGYALPEARRRYLREAIDAVIAGERVRAAALTAPGCELLLDINERPKSHVDVTWHGRVSRIVQNNCQVCHRPGESAPFELLTYEDAVNHKGMIKRVVSRGTMPPWFADGESAAHFVNDSSLSAAERLDVVRWVENDCPEGDPADAPLPRKWVEGWKIGEPDLVVKTRGYDVPARGVLPYRNTIVLSPLTEDKWVTAAEIRSSQPQVVHHVLVFAQYPRNHPRRGDQPRHRGGVHGYFAGMVPGQGHTVYPKGAAKFLPRGAILRFQIHYTPNGEAVQDEISLGLRFADGKPKHEVHTVSAAETKFVIPAGDPAHRVVAERSYHKPVRIISLMPHMHVRGKAFKYELIDADGETTTLLNVPRYDFNWQLQYRLAEPVTVPAGVKLRATAWFDNSPENPANPDPTRDVRFGEQTWDEMMIGYFDVIVAE